MRSYVTAGRARVTLLLLVLCGSSASAHADWLFTPFLGSTFAGATAIPDLDQSTGGAHLILGGEAGWWSSGLFGIETDFAYVPSFFESSTVGLVTDSNVLTLGMDVVIATPLSVTRESLRPYVIGGAGWMHSSIDEGQNFFPELFRARNSVAVNVGGGAIGFFSPRTGVRFEVRHFRSLKRDTDQLTGETSSLLSFWRVTAGIVIKR